MSLNTVGVLEDLAVSLVVWHVEVLLLEWRGLEALSTVPGHILDRDQGAVGKKQEVKHAVTNDSVVSTLDDAGKRAETGLDRLVAVRKEIVTASADHVVCWWRVNGFLDISAVEVVVWPSSKRWEAEQVPLIRAVVCQVVNIETWVFVVCRVVDIVVNITTWLLPAGGGRDFAGWWEFRGPLVEEIGISTAICASRNICNVALVQVDHIIVVLQRRYNRCYNC